MALFSESNIRARAQQEMLRSSNLYKSKKQVLNEAVATFNSYLTYDIFLSHSSKDAELILGVKATLEDLGYRIYVDWVDDAQLDRSNVNESTAQLLRERMKASKSLFYVTTDNAVTSKWMPWECGYFDGYKEKVVILPVSQYSFSTEYNGQEYLGLYPYCMKNPNKLGEEKLWIHKNKEYYLVFENWIKEKREDLQWNKMT